MSRFFNCAWNNPSDSWAWNYLGMWWHLSAPQLERSISLNQMSLPPVQVYTVEKGPTVINEVTHYTARWHTTEETRRMTNVWKETHSLKWLTGCVSSLRSKYFTGQLCNPPPELTSRLPERDKHLILFIILRANVQLQYRPGNLFRLNAAGGKKASASSWHEAYSRHEPRGDVCTVISQQLRDGGRLNI